MRIYAHHDPDRKVRSVIDVNAPVEISMMLTSKPGVLVSELTGVKVKAGPGHLTALRKLAKSHKISQLLPARKAARKHQSCKRNAKSVGRLRAALFSSRISTAIRPVAWHYLACGLTRACY